MTHHPYDEDFKKSIVALYQNGKTQSQLSKEYGVSLSAIGKWIRLYSEVKTVDGDIMTAKQIKDLQRRNAKLEEENLILKKQLPHTKIDCFPYESHDKQSLHDKKAVRSCRFPFQYV